jgi:hypothetical protein
VGGSNKALCGKSFPKVVDLHGVRSYRNSIILLVPAAIAGFYLFSFKYLPLQDYPDWLYQGCLFKQFFFQGNDFGGYYTFHGHIPPNVASTIGIGILNIVFDPFNAGKIYLFFALMLVYWGAYSYLREFSNTKWITNCIVAIYFMFNLHFLVGNISFLFGLGFALSSFCYLYHKKKLQNIPYQFVIILICYCSHFLALIIYLLLVAIYVSNKERARVYRNVFIAALPSCALFVHYWLSKTLSTFNPDNLLNTPLQMGIAKIVVISVSSIPFHRYKGVLELPALMKGINYAVSGVAVVAALSALFFIFKNRKYTGQPLLIISIVFILVLLPYEIAGLFFPAERFMIPLFIALIGYFSSIAHSITLRRTVFTFMLVLVGSSLCYNFIMLFQFNKMLSSYSIPRQEDIAQMKYKEGNEPFQRLDVYSAIEENRPIPIFTTGFFTFRGANPASFNGKWQQ